MSGSTWLLLAQYKGKAVIPIDDVCRDYFSHLTPKKLAEKISKGEIRLPMVRIEESQKASRGIHLDHLAAWIDARTAAAEKELSQVTRGVPVSGTSSGTL